MARLRLVAGCCMMKLAQEPLFADLITLEQFQSVAYLLVVSGLLTYSKELLECPCRKN